MRRTLVALTLAAAGVLTAADRAQAQVIYYGTPGYYHSPHNPLVRTWSTPYVYSTYTSPIIVPTRFTYPYWGSVTYGTVAPIQPAVPTPGNAATIVSESKTDETGTTTASNGIAQAGGTTAAVTPAGGFIPAPAFVQVGHSTYTPAPVAVGSVYYSGDAYIPPSRYYYYPYSTYPTAGFAPYGPTLPPSTSFQYSSYAGYTSPYFQVNFGQGYGGWGNGRGWGYRW